jgi:hypothetical protein
LKYAACINKPFIRPVSKKPGGIKEIVINPKRKFKLKSGDVILYAAAIYPDGACVTADDR